MIINKSEKVKKAKKEANDEKMPKKKKKQLVNKSLKMLLQLEIRKNLLNLNFLMRKMCGKNN